MKRVDSYSSVCETNLEVPDPVCQRSIYPPVDEYVKEATTLALCGVKPSWSRERSSEWLEVIRGQTYRQPGVLINNWFDEGQDIVHLRQEKCILSDVCNIGLYTLSSPLAPRKTFINDRGGGRGGRDFPSYSITPSLLLLLPVPALASSLSSPSHPSSHLPYPPVFSQFILFIVLTHTSMGSAVSSLSASKRFWCISSWNQLTNLIAWGLNKTPTCKNWLILLFRKIDNKIPAASAGATLGHCPTTF